MRTFFSLMLLLSTGCVGPRYIRTNPPSRLPIERVHGINNHLVLISVDGLRPDAIAAFQATTLERLIHEGSSTLTATTIVPSKTLPSHTSMLSGQPPVVHGVSWNTNVSLRRRAVASPTVFSALRSKGYITAAFFSKAKFGSLQQPGTLDYSQAPGGWFGHWSADRTVRDVEQYLASGRPDLLFIHLGDPDYAGHHSGWMSAKYGEAVKRIDQAIERLVMIAQQSFGPDNFTLIVTADHGGHGRNHGSSDPRDMTIPWIAWGHRVKPGQLATSVKTMDTAATVLWLFGAGEISNSTGIPVIEAFERTSDDD